MKFKLTIIFYLFAINGFSQFLEPGISIGVNSYSGDLKRGYSLSDGSMGLEIFNRFNISSHQTFKFSYKRGNLKGSERINDNLSSNRNMWFKAKFSEVSLKFEYNFLDYFDEINRENFTPYLFMGLGSTLLKNTFERNNSLGKNKKLLINIPFGIGFKYLINKQFSVAFEFEIKKTFNDDFDLTNGANTRDIDNITGLTLPNSNIQNFNKNYQYGSGNDKDFYYFTGISISYIFYRIPCPKDSAPINSIY